METRPSGKPKSIKFETIHLCLRDQFGDISIVESAKVLNEAFPNATKGRAHGGKIAYTGIEFAIPRGDTDPCPPSVSLPLQTTSMVELAQECQRSQELSRQVKSLQVELAQLKEAASLAPADPVTTYHSEFEHLLQYGQNIKHGPNTQEHIFQFSITEVANELQSHAPQLYGLFNSLGDTSRNRRPGHQRAVEEIKAIVSLCTLINARSIRSNGVQLSVGLGLIARGTHRQVMNTLSWCSCKECMYFILTSHNNISTHSRYSECSIIWE